MPLQLPPLNAPIWSKQFQLIGIAASAITGFTVMGANMNSTGTFSITTTTEATGIVTQNTCTAAINATCGIASARSGFCRGSVAGQINGFKLFARAYYPNASYDNTGASTGCRIFLGLSDQSATNIVNSADPAGNRIGFSRQHVNGSLTDTNWYVTSKDGFTENRINTGITFTAQHVYDFYILCEPMGEDITWEIIDRTANTSASGTVIAGLPAAATLLSLQHMLLTINATARAIGFQRFYIESGV